MTYVNPTALDLARYHQRHHVPFALQTMEQVMAAVYPTLDWVETAVVSLPADMLRDIARQNKLAANSVEQITRVPTEDKLYPKSKTPARSLQQRELDTNKPLALKDGVYYDGLAVRNGTLKQVANVLDEDFTIKQNSTCYLRRHGDSLYWHIEAREKGGKLSASRKTTPIGYVYVSDRPLIHIKIFLFEEGYKAMGRSLRQRIGCQLRNSHFEIESNGRQQDEAAYTCSWGEYKPFRVRRQLDDLTDWIKSFLLSQGHIAECKFLKQHLDEEDGIKIDYPFSHCVICFKIEFLQSYLMRVQPFILFKASDLQIDHALKVEVEQHLEVMLDELKNGGRWEPEKPTKKPKPNAKKENFYPWFDYYHGCNKANIKYTFANMAADLHVSEGHIKNLHSFYKIDHGL